MGIQATNRSYGEALGTIGKVALSALFPSEFEVYLMAIELTDSDGRTIDYFAFPVMPESISKSEPKRVNVKKTSSGVTVLSSDSYTPEELTIKGNFGRSFKLMTSQKDGGLEGFAFSVNAGKTNLLDVASNGANVKQNSFSAGIKTGFGALKMLQAILSKSNGTDRKGKPFRLYLYNMALGESYLVTVTPSGPTYTQSIDKNMVWNYSVSFSILAPLQSVRGGSTSTSASRTLSRGAIQKSVYDLARSITQNRG